MRTQLEYGSLRNAAVAARSRLPPHHDDIAGSSRLIAEIALEVALGVDRAGHGDAGKGRERSYIDIDAVLTVEQAVDFVTDCILERAYIEVLALRLTCQDQTGRIGNRGLERLPGKEDDGGLDDCEYQSKERSRHQAKFNHGSTILATKKTAYPASRKAGGMMCKFPHKSQHGQTAHHSRMPGWKEQLINSPGAVVDLLR
jgi:hypothetical protein